MAEKIVRVLGKKGRITIPYNIRKELDIKKDDVLSFEISDDNTVLITKEKLCAGKVHKCFKRETETALENFLDSLTPEQQRKACIYLNIMVACKEGVLPSGN